jgi:hypothetical protein
MLGDSRRALAFMCASRARGVTFLRKSLSTACRRALDRVSGRTQRNVLQCSSLGMRCGMPFGCRSFLQIYPA